MAEARAGRGGSADLGEFVVADREGYVAMAVALGAQPERVVLARREMRERVRASDVCNGQRLARDMETLYRRMYAEAVEARSAHH